MNSLVIQKKSSIQHGRTPRSHGPQGPQSLRAATAVSASSLSSRSRSSWSSLIIINLTLSVPKVIVLYLFLLIVFPEIGKLEDRRFSSSSRFHKLLKGIFLTIHESSNRSSTFARINPIVKEVGSKIAPFVIEAIISGVIMSYAFCFNLISFDCCIIYLCP